ncbi:THAP domain-containing protein 5 [Ixodes scapularis]|uniref:THAP domain-containing protein 5 n=1 Tax=Ixodes scapularis TaxID=6945 RepID=UPI001C387A3E|nr:THAP domain-containing protein 5 [Ixodes scapularis]
MWYAAACCSTLQGRPIEPLGMPQYCCAPLCKQKGVTDDLGDKVSFFSFPSDPVVRKKWVIAIKRDEGKLFQITKYTRLCSKHFQQSDYLANYAGSRRFLRQNAVPSIFAFNTAARPPRREPRRRLPLPPKQELSTAAAEGSANDDVADLDATCDSIADAESVANAEDTGSSITDADIVTNENATSSSIADESSVANEEDTGNSIADTDSDDRLQQQDLENQTATKAELIKNLQFELTRCQDQLKGAEDTLKQMRSELELALIKCRELDAREIELSQTKHALYKAIRKLELALEECRTLKAKLCTV